METLILCIFCPFTVKLVNGDRRYVMHHDYTGQLGRREIVVHTIQLILP